jgi:hypothetical protein
MVAIEALITLLRECDSINNEEVCYYCKGKARLRGGVYK